MGIGFFIALLMDYETQKTDSACDRCYFDGSVYLGQTEKKQGSGS